MFLGAAKDGGATATAARGAKAAAGGHHILWFLFSLAKRAIDGRGWRGGELTAQFDRKIGGNRKIEIESSSGCRNEASWGPSPNGRRNLREKKKRGEKKKTGMG